MRRCALLPGAATPSLGTSGKEHNMMRNFIGVFTALSCASFVFADANETYLLVGA